MKMNKYKIDHHECVYEWDTDKRAYIYIGRLKGTSLEQFIRNHEGK